MQLQRNRARIAEDQRQMDVYREHVRTVAEATRLNQELLQARRSEAEAEAGQLKVQEVLQVRRTTGRQEQDRADALLCRRGCWGTGGGARPGWSR